MSTDDAMDAASSSFLLVPAGTNRAMDQVGSTWLGLSKPYTETGFESQFAGVVLFQLRLYILLSSISQLKELFPRALSDLVHVCLNCVELQWINDSADLYVESRRKSPEEFTDARKYHPL
jgi:hypothetical protein